MILATLLLALAALQARDRHGADVVELKDGTKVEGRVVFQDDANVVVRANARDREIAMKDVASVRSRNAALRTVLDRWNARVPSDPAGMLDLAYACQKTNLADEAQIFAWRALLLDPKNEDAHKFLGHTLHEGTWTVREGIKTIPYDHVHDARREWKDAWEFATTHYHLRTNLDLGPATDIALELEGFYRTFFDVFGRELTLYDVVDPMTVYIYADKRSYPSLISRRDAYFDERTSTLNVNASAGFDVHVLFHEATHGILYNTAERTKNALGDIPGWLHEGLAEYLGACVSGSGGKTKLSPRAYWPDHFRVQAQARQPLDLARVLTLAIADFQVDQGAELKYAEAYTLVYFLLHGENEKYRKGFLDFVRSAYRGQSSMSHFRETLGGHGGPIEAEWVAYVKSVAAETAPPSKPKAH